MRKGILLIMSCAVLMGASSLFAQNINFDYNPSYGPAPQVGPPQSLAKRLSYENFRSLKLLNTAIMNFGGGTADIDKLIDQYAEASALYFQNKMPESANAFKANEAAILAVAKQLAQKYQQDSSALLKDSMNMSIRAKLKQQIKGGAERLGWSDKFLEQAQAGVLKANDYYDRFKDAKSVSSMELITAIYYYRGAKDSMFQMMRVLADHQSKLQAEEEVNQMIANKELARSKKEDMIREKESQKKKDLLSRYLDKYAKDIVDNKNMVYQSREKEK